VSTETQNTQQNTQHSVTVTNCCDCCCYYHYYQTTLCHTCHSLCHILGEPWWLLLCNSITSPTAVLSLNQQCQSTEDTATVVSCRITLQQNSIIITTNILLKIYRMTSYRVDQSSCQQLWKVCFFLYVITQKGAPCIKIFSSLSGVRLVFPFLPYLLKNLCTKTLVK